MNRKREAWRILIALLVTNIMLTIIFSVAVLADERELKMDMKIHYKGEELLHNSREIYYLNDDVTFEFPSVRNEEISNYVSAEEEQRIENEINLAKEAHSGEEVSIYVDEYKAVAVFDGNKFGNYKEIADNTYKLVPEDSDSYRRTALKFRLIRSFKICIGGSLNERGTVDRVIDFDYYSNAYQIFFDKTCPEISCINREVFDRYISDEEMAQFNIKDEAGLLDIQVVKDGSIVDSVEFNSDKRMVEYDYSVFLTNEKEEDEILIRAHDLSGNMAEYELNYKTDTVAPKLIIKDNVSGSASVNEIDGKVYDSVARLDIVASDNSDSLNIYYKCYYTGENGTPICLENETSKYDAQTQLSREYVDEGIYDIVSFAYDENGNYSETIRVSFGVDTKAPEVLFDKISNHGIYNSDASICAVVNEMFFDSTTVEIKGEVTDEKGVHNVSLSPYVIEAKQNRNIYNFSRDGHYKIELKATDFLGRCSNSLCEFTIDRTAPNITINIEGSNEDNISDVANSTSVKPTLILDSCPVININTKDNCLEYNAMAYLYKKEPEGAYKEVKNEIIKSVGRSACFLINVEKEGEYLLKVLAKDEAGNESEKSISFIVDETSPIIGYVDSFNEKYLKYFLLPENIKEYISDMTEVGYKAYLNSKEIGSCEIKKDGKYILKITATDEASNEAEKTIAFIIDNTEPKVIVKGLEDGGQVKKDGIVTLTLFDKDDFFKKVSVNGKEIGIPNENREVLVKADTYGDYDISVVASDYAGNEVTEVIKMQCAMASNPFSVKVDKSEVKTLTKNQDEIRESFSLEKVVIKALIFSGIILATVVIFVIFTRVDTKNNKG